MAIDHVPFTFNRHHPEEVLSRMTQLAGRTDGKAWMSFQPQVDDDSEVGQGSFGLFSGRGPVIPNGTWVPAHQRGRRRIAASLGLEHSAGKGAVAQLREHGVAVPEGWTVQQDHPRRGLTFVLPEDADPRTILDFVVTAGSWLTPLEVGDEWYALVSEQR